MPGITGQMLFSSIGTALKISGAILLGEPWRILDPIAGVVVSFFILKVAWNIAKPSISELLDSSLPEKTERTGRNYFKKKELNFSQFKNQKKIGENISVEVHIKVDKNMTVELSHQIASKIEHAIREIWRTYPCDNSC